MKTKNKCEFVINCHLFDAIDLHKTIFVVNQLQIKLHKSTWNYKPSQHHWCYRTSQEKMKQFCKMMVMIEKTNNFTTIWQGKTSSCDKL
jgi:hypothetical protein